ncbi:copper amine oxidase N-terminal domain-containing protein [Acetoanaerobium noterae]|uniref:copper amine oxidase N-terminal domain-containing protein n=1 Tax=Acetoanaerobium noterae TaxID=745369 RepID=UPI003342BFDD
MKKNNILFKSFLHKLGIITLIFISIFTFSYGSSPVYANHSIGVYIDNKPLKMDVPPIIRSGRTLVPISAIGNALSCKITWNERNQSVIIRKQASIIRLSINSKLAYIDDNPMHLDYPPIIVNGRTMVPLSFVANALNYDIKWDPVRMNVYVHSDPVNMTMAEAKAADSSIKVLDITTLEMNIDGQIKKVQLANVVCANEDNKLLNTGGACILSSISNPKLDEIKELLASGNVSVKVTQNLDKDTVIAEVYIDGTSLSQLLIELGYANSINN